MKGKEYMIQVQPDSRRILQMSLSELRSLPIPDQAEARERRKGFRDFPIDLKDPRSSEPLQDIATAEIRGLSFYHRKDNPPYYVSVPGSLPSILLRQGIVKKLVEVNSFLKRLDVELFVHDGFRPVAVQEYFYHTWMPGYLKSKNPSLSGEALREAVEQYWSRPPTPDEVRTKPSPHLTGAAVDLGLAYRATGHLVDMGGLFDDPNQISHRDQLELEKPSNISMEEGRAWRRVLHWAMVAHGFEGHPNEWWHFSIGDQLWAKLNGQRAAYYGAAAEALK